MTAPIALFVFNRLDHLKKTLKALQENHLASDSDLYIYSDGPSDDLKVQEVRNEIRAISGFKSVTVVERESNFGLAKSIINGVSELTSKYGKVIVLEDDIVTSPFFLKYMNDSLDLYQDENRVMHISGYMFPVESKNLPGTFFLKPTSCWGWATWKRSWDLFSNDISAIENKMSAEMIFDFNLDNSHDYYVQVLQNKRKERITWAIFWYASVFLNNGLSLHPKYSYCFNIGHDGSGTNCGATSIFDVNVQQDYICPEKLSIHENINVRKELIKYYKNSRPSLVRRVLRRLMNL